MKTIQRHPQNIRSTTENNGRAVDLDREAHDGAGVSGVGYQPDAVGPVAESGHRGDAQSPGPEQEGPCAATESSTLTADRKEADRAQWPKLERRLAAIQKTKEPLRHSSGWLP